MVSRDEVGQEGELEATGLLCTEGTCGEEASELSPGAAR